MWKFTPGKNPRKQKHPRLGTHHSAFSGRKSKWSLRYDGSLHTFILFQMPVWHERDWKSQVISTRPQVADSEVEKAPTYEWESWYRTHMLFIRNSYLPHCTVFLFAKSGHYTNVTWPVRGRARKNTQPLLHCELSKCQAFLSLSISLFFGGGWGKVQEIFCVCFCFYWVNIGYITLHKIYVFNIIFLLLYISIF